MNKLLLLGLIFLFVPLVSALSYCDYFACYNDVGGSPLFDKSGLGNNLTNNGAVYNQTGGNYMFNGINSYLYPSSYINTYTYTYCLWASLINNNEVSHMVAYTNIPNTRFYYSFNKIALYVYNSTGTVIGSHSISSLALNNTGYHFACYSSNTTSISLSIDGSGWYNVNYTYPYNEPRILLKIGQGAGTAKYFNGSIDDVRIFNRSLSAEEILAIYNEGRN